MITEKVKVSKSGEGMNEALELTDELADYLKLQRKKAFHLRLLAEELLSMVRAITENFKGDFWLEEENHTCKLILEAKAELDYAKRREFLDVSTKGENISHRGIMEKIREIFEAGLYSMQESFNIQAQYGTGMFAYGAIDGVNAGISEAVYAWSMQKYKDNINSERSVNSDAWDELEKSIIANIADDVQVGVTKDSVKLIVIKYF
ncbi:MAG: hypothetical protein IJU48_02150 [Synergistaceae bacterium]|nr:hypothetical protein [Synergistaceae bacterium]